MAGGATGSSSVTAGLDVFYNNSTTSLSYTSQSQTSPSTSESSTRRSGLRRALFAVKKGLRTAFRRVVSCGTTPSGTKVPIARKVSVKRSASIRSKLSARSRRSRTAMTARASSSTPSICLTHPTLNGKNQRLSIHQGPLIAAAEGFGGDRRKIIRFSHPVVDAMVPQTDLTPMASPAARSFVSASSWGSWETVGSEVSLATADTTSTEANKVSAGVKLSDVQSCYAARGYLDGLRGRARPVSTVEAVPALPYVAYSPEVSLEELSTDAGRAKYAQKVKAELAAKGKVEAGAPIVLVLPQALVPGQQNAPTGLKSETLSSPRTTAARPHTTGELPSVAPGTSFLPYIAYNPSFNPYNSSKVSSPYGQGKAPASDSDTSLGAAFAEFEAAEQAAHTARHSAHYARVESGVFHSPVVVRFPEAPTPAPVPAHEIRRKPVPSSTPKPAPSSTSKPLPAVPSNIAMLDNGFPFLDAARARAYFAVPNYSRRSINEVEAKHRKEEAAKKGKRTQEAAVEAGVAKLML